MLFKKDFKRMKRSSHSFAYEKHSIITLYKFRPTLPCVNDSKIELDVGCSRTLQISELYSYESAFSTFHLMFSSIPTGNSRFRWGLVISVPNHNKLNRWWYK